MLNKDDVVQTNNVDSEGGTKEADQGWKLARNKNVHQFERSKT